MIGRNVSMRGISPLLACLSYTVESLEGLAIEGGGCGHPPSHHDPCRWCRVCHRVSIQRQFAAILPTPATTSPTRPPSTTPTASHANGARPDCHASSRENSKLNRHRSSSKFPKASKSPTSSGLSIPTSPPVRLIPLAICQWWQLRGQRPETTRHGARCDRPHRRRSRRDQQRICSRDLPKRARSQCQRHQSWATAGTARQPPWPVQQCSTKPKAASHRQRCVGFPLDGLEPVFGQERSTKPLNGHQDQYPTRGSLSSHQRPSSASSQLEEAFSSATRGQGPSSTAFSALPSSCPAPLGTS